MTGLGFVASIVLFILSVTGVLALPFLTIAAPLLIGLGIDLVLIIISLIFQVSFLAFFRNRF